MKTLLLGALLPLIAGTATLRAADDKPAASAPAAVATCPVSGEELGSMGDSYEYIHKEEGKPDRVVKLCCKMCVAKFKKDPAKYLAKLDAPAAGASGGAHAH
jgi:hypothetical protein